MSPQGGIWRFPMYDGFHGFDLPPSPRGGNYLGKSKASSGAKTVVLPYIHTFIHTFVEHRQFDMSLSGPQGGVGGAGGPQHVILKDRCCSPVSQETAATTGTTA